jgi:hypothetical protein
MQLLRRLNKQQNSQFDQKKKDKAMLGAPKNS